MSIGRRLRDIWRPEVFHYPHRLNRGADPRRVARGGGTFEGWYLKLVDAGGQQPLALIPGVFLGEDRHAFVQVLDGRRGVAAYHRFPIESFRAASDRFEIAIGANRFSRDGLALDLPEAPNGKQPALRGEVRFGAWRPWPVTWLSPGIMGPYSFVPFMECNHGILSLDHALDGALELGGSRIDYAGGRGYVEKDWGRSFPAGYVWTHSNHFDRPGVCLTAAVAIIPWLTGAFRGFIIGLLVDGTLHRFTTYTGSVLERLELDDTHLVLRIRNRTHRLSVEARKEAGAVLHAPYEQQMLERVAETMTSEVDVQLERLAGGALDFAGRGTSACLEAQGDLARVLDRPVGGARARS